MPGLGYLLVHAYQRPDTIKRCGCDILYGSWRVMCLWDCSRSLAGPIQLELLMNKTRSIYALVAFAAVALAGLGASGAAQARGDVNWSIGVGVPGVVVGVGNGYQGYSGYQGYAPPVYYAPPPPVYYAPPPPVYYAPPRPVYYAPPVMVGPPAYGYYGGRYYQQRPHRHDRRGDRGDYGDRGNGHWRR